MELKVYELCNKNNNAIFHNCGIRYIFICNDKYQYCMGLPCEFFFEMARLKNKKIKLEGAILIKGSFSKVHYGIFNDI